MKLDRSELKRLARLGAEAELKRLGDEAEATLLRLKEDARTLFAVFPDLAKKHPQFTGVSTFWTVIPTSGKPRTSGAKPRKDIGVSRKKKRKGMSAAARRAVSKRMTKYWAARRKAKK